MLMVTGEYETFLASSENKAVEGAGSTKRGHTSHTGTLREIINSGILIADTVMVSNVKKWQGSGNITSPGDIVVDRKTFWSPSAAGKYVAGGLETTGWDFWAVKQPDGSLKGLSEYRDVYNKRVRRGEQ